MATVALIAVGILALLVAVLFGALAEMFRDVRQMRDAIGILDRPLPIDIGSARGAAPQRYGLPAALDAESSALVLFLSDRCGTCRQLVSALVRPIPDGLWLVLEIGNATAAAAFVERFGLQEQERVVIDSDGTIAERLGVQTTPVAFRVEHGRFTQAMTVPSSRYLVSILPEPIRLRVAG